MHFATGWGRGCPSESSRGSSSAVAFAGLFRETPGLPQPAPRLPHAHEASDQGHQGHDRRGDASVGRGDVQFLHHLAGFYADVAGNGDEAVKRARQDAALRPSYAADDTLAWALYRNGNVAEAVIASDRALASTMVDAHLYYHAARIKAAAGDAEAARGWTAALQDVNPHYEDFHAHR